MQQACSSAATRLVSLGVIHLVTQTGRSYVLAPSWLLSCINAVRTVSQALCTEASLHALRRTYPQIYDTDDKLLINPSQVVVGRHDFLAAHAAITPSAQRQAASPARYAAGLLCMRASCCLVVLMLVLADAFMPLACLYAKMHAWKPPSGVDEALPACRPLSEVVGPALEPCLRQVVEQLCSTFPAAAACLAMAEQHTSSQRGQADAVRPSPHQGHLGAAL